MGTIVLGTPKRVISMIWGRTSSKSWPKPHGFRVVDLGVNVPVDTFVESVRVHSPDIVGLSGLLTTTFPSMKEVVEALVRHGLRKGVKVIIGGGATGKEAQRYVGADAQTLDAGEGVKIVSPLLDELRGRGKKESCTMTGLEQLKACVSLEKVDRPGLMPSYMDRFACIQRGLTFADILDMPDEAARAMRELWQELGGYGDCPYYAGGTDIYYLAVKHLTKIRVPGREIPRDLYWQIWETPVFSREEYDLLIEKGSMHSSSKCSRAYGLSPTRI